MAAKVIDGKALAREMREEIRLETEALAARGTRPGLAVVLVGEDPASLSYVRGKEKALSEAGMYERDHRLPESVSQEHLLSLIGELNQDPRVHGILVQLPLPAHIDTERVVAAIDPDKDVDGFHPINVGGLSASNPAALVPCTPYGCLMMLRERFNGDLSGQHAVVIGRSNIVGKPMAQLLLQEHCTVTIAHSRTRDLPGLCRRADILVAAVGRPEMVREDWVKPGAVVIDVGINRIAVEGEAKGRLVGDVAFDEVCRVASAVSPVPGGVGPMTIACLLRNAVVAACRQRGVACSL